ncbi:unnamed protein product [Linum tenue]|uniref:Peptidase metallopeptidase domain-containing protein n=1 Tax=Linum tenue TaxID=586396 RepID=A0AAV0L3I5_9ROSI|nr:unnamed protein product [Linum tenue]
MTLFRVFAATFLLVSLVVLNSPTFAVGHTSNNPFGFIHRLEGSRRGQSIEGLRDAKHYLQKFGYYLNDDHKDTNVATTTTHQNDDEFDEFLEAAIKRYQLTHRIPVSGALDRATTAQMMIPRCGVSDHGLVVMTVLLAEDQNKSEDYRFFKGKPKWNKNHLRYKFPKSNPPAGLKEATIKAAVARAFRSWENVTELTFENVGGRAKADMQISFYSRDHGDGFPFDGPNGTTAHAFQPRYGRLHYDADEKWSDDPSPMEMDLESIGVHEIGHTLGLLHSDDEAAIMYPYLNYGQIKRKLQSADVKGIRKLYGLP